MAIERVWKQIKAIPFVADGTQGGIVTVEDTKHFKVKMAVVLKADGIEPKRYEIKRVLSNSQLILGPEKEPIQKRSDISIYTVALNSTIEAPEQERPKIPPADYERATYEEEPVVAKRVIPVNRYGELNSPDNPLYAQLTDGEINIGTVNAELEVQLSHKDNFPDAGDVRDAVNVVDNFLIKRFEKINNITYEGLADQGSLPSEAKWRITRTIKQPNGDLVTSIVGDTSYDQVWNDRATLFSPATSIDFFDRKWEKILPTLNNANFLKLGNFDAVVPSFSGNIATINYFEGGANIARITVRYVHELDWDMNLESFINDTNGDILLDDDGSPLILE
jgi:hypothetical protein